MNEFIEFESKSVEKAQSLWCEKYRPDVVENYICSDQLRSILIDFLTKKDIPHLLFHGSAGTGKCLAYEESIDIEMEVTNDEYEILKKYEIH